MCKFNLLFDKIIKYFKNIQKFCRIVALLDAILGLIILAILIIKRLRSVHEYDDSTIYPAIVLGLQIFEIVFALVLYEGVRREIVWMIKIWFLYCVARFLILTSAVYPTLISTSRHKLKLVIFGIEAAFTLFHLIQCIFLLALHKHGTSTNDDDAETGNENKEMRRCKCEDGERRSAEWCEIELNTVKT